MVKQSFVQGKVNGQNMNMICMDHCNFQYFLGTTFAEHNAQAQECLHCGCRFQHSFYVTREIWNGLNNPNFATISLASGETLEKWEVGCCLIGLSSIWHIRIFAGWHTIQRHQLIQSFSSWKESRPFPNNPNSNATQVTFDFVLLGNGKLTNLLVVPVHQILIPHIFLLFQCFATFAEPNSSKQHLQLLTTWDWWQTEMKFFVACLPCCQSTKSVCHRCTTKTSIHFLAPFDPLFKLGKAQLTWDFTTVHCQPIFPLVCLSKSHAKLITQAICLLRRPFRSTPKRSFVWFSSTLP